MSRFHDAIRVDILDRRCADEWDQLALTHPECSFFHSAAWARVICQTYRQAPLYFYLPREGEPSTMVPLIEILSPLTGRRAVSLPFSDFCAPLVFNQNRLSLVRDELSKLAGERAWKYFEIRGGDGFEPTAETALAFYGHELPLSGGADAVFEHFSNSTKGAVRQALKSDLNVEIFETSEAIEEFYRLHARTRRRHGAPPQPLAFFMNIHKHVIKAGLGFVVLARSGLRAVAGAVFFRFGQQGIYKYAASDPKFGRSRGNNLVMWKAIQSLIEQGARVLHMGRTTMDNEGLRRFKLSWGAKEEMIRYYRFDGVSGRRLCASNHSKGVHNRLFRNLPLGVNRLAGAMLYPHLD